MKLKNYVTLALALSMMCSNVYAEQTLHELDTAEMAVIEQTSSSVNEDYVEQPEEATLQTESKVSLFAGGSGSQEDPYQISTAEELDKIREDMNASYVLVNDIDLQGVSWTPIGEYVPGGGEEGEVPDPNYSFNGNFDGNGHTISNFTIDNYFVTGIFGCANKSTIKNINITNAEVRGGLMAACVVGYIYNGELAYINLQGQNKVTAYSGEMGLDMVGGIGGGSMLTTASDCFASVDIVAEDGGKDIGLAFGGYEDCSISGCVTSGKITVGNDAFGIGGITGCNFGGDKISDCSSEVEISTGDNAYLVGGIAGYTGGFEEKTIVNNCTSNVKFNLGENATRIGAILGGGFFKQEYAEMMPNSGMFTISACSSNGEINYNSGDFVGQIAGYTLLSEVDESNISTVTFNSQEGALIGDEVNYTVLNALTGTYQPFFKDGVFLPKYDNIWHDYCAAVVGEETASMWVNILKNSMSGTLYGKEAVEKYKASPESIQFNCGFINDVDRITINGSQISGTDKQGNLLFSHTYHYYDTLDSTDFPGFTFDIFETNEENGEFKYFAFAPDTPSSTYHIEFRYGSNVDEILSLVGGKYAYWLGAGIREQDLKDDVTTERVIALFCTENMDYSTRTESSLSQLTDISGRWDCDMSKISGFGNAQMYIELGNDGIGKTYLDMAGTGNYVLESEYEYYAYNNSSTNSSGIYVVNSPDEGIKYSKYEIISDGSTKTLQFKDIDGTDLIAYKRDIQSTETTTEQTTKSVTRSSGGGGGSSKGRVIQTSTVTTEITSETTTSETTTSTEQPKEKTAEVKSDAEKSYSQNIVLTIGKLKANVFGDEIDLLQAPYIFNERTMLPIRFISENLGYNVDWDEENKKAVISQDDTVIELYSEKETAFTNGEETIIDTSVQNKGGTLFVPARFIFESLNAHVEWDNATKTVTISF